MICEFTYEQVATLVLYVSVSLALVAIIALVAVAMFRD